MTKEEAREALKYHSFADEQTFHPKMNKGFLGMLRLFTGTLIEENYHEVMQVIKVLADKLRNNDKIDKEVVSAIWGICHLARSWGIDSQGMLRRNNLIKKDQVQQLEDWIEAISYATMIILDGGDDKTAFEFYKDG